VFRIGLVSDTHNLLRPEVLAFLQGSDHVVHAGDICGPEVMAALSAIAPLTVVRGNNDRGPWAEKIPEAVTVQLAGIHVHVVHDAADLVLPEGVNVVVTGHSHRPRVEERDGVLYVNPGSAGPRRFKLPISAGELVVDAGSLTPRLVTF
jgi:putative phosphoesterase